MSLDPRISKVLSQIGVWSSQVDLLGSRNVARISDSSETGDKNDTVVERVCVAEKMDIAKTITVIAGASAPVRVS